MGSGHTRLFNDDRVTGTAPTEVSVQSWILVDDAPEQEVSACMACTAGQYAAEGSIACEFCASGTADEDSDASTPCIECPAGTYAGCADTECATCPFGSVDDDLDPTTPCTVCKAGNYYQGLTVPVSSASWAASGGGNRLSNRDANTGTMGDLMSSMNGGSNYVRHRSGHATHITTTIVLDGSSDVYGVGITVGHSPDTQDRGGVETAGYAGIEVHTRSSGGDWLCSTVDR